MNELDKIQSNLPTTAPTTNTFTAEAGGLAIGTNNGNIYNGVDNATVQAIFGQLSVITKAIGSTEEKEEPSHAIEWANMSRERYCLFVLDNENYTTGSFSIPFNRALKYTDDFTRNGLIKLTSADREIIKTMPCIFAVKNKTFKHAPEGFPFMVGKVTDIVIQGENIKFSFTTFKPAFEQRLLNENTTILKLKERTCRNQLDEAHWAVIKNDLIEIGNRIGIKVN